MSASPHGSSISHPESEFTKHNETDERIYEKFGVIE